MARLICIALFLSFYSSLIYCSTWNVHLVYKPYGPKMCRKVCEDSTYAFLFTKDDLSCRLIVAEFMGGLKDRPLEDSFVCWKDDTGMNIRTSLTDLPASHIRSINSKDDSLDKLSTSHTHLATCTDDLQVDKNITLYRACQIGDLCVVKYILSRGLEDINSKGYKRRTPVMTAVLGGHGAVFNFFVSHNCDLSGRDAYGDNILHMACISGNIDIVKTLVVDKQFDVDARGWKGMSPVMCAALYGHRSVFHFLVSQDCDLSFIDCKNDNVLHYACKGGNKDIVETLVVKKQFDIEVLGQREMTPVMFAARFGRGEVFDFLVSQGCNLSRTDTLNNNILHLACKGGNVEIVKTLVFKKQFDIEGKGEKEITPVLTAVCSGHRSVFELLMENGCNLRAKDKEENNILHNACFGGREELVDYIISQNIVHKESRNYFGETPIMKAVKGNHIEVVKLLIKRGCSSSAMDTKGNNVLHIACRRRFLDMVNYILNNDLVDKEEANAKGRTPLLTTAVHGHKEEFDALVRKGCNIRVTDFKHNNILHRACAGGHVDMVRYILTQNVVSIESKNSYGQTPLLVAAVSGIRRVVGVLVNYGCNQSAQDKEGSNILHIACKEGYFHLVEYIVTNNLVGMESRDMEGRTPVMVAVLRRENLRIVKLLVNQERSLKATDDNGNSVLHLACSSGNKDVVEYLIRHGNVDYKQKNNLGRTPAQVAQTKKLPSIVFLLKAGEYDSQS